MVLTIFNGVLSKRIGCRVGLGFFVVCSAGCGDLRVADLSREDAGPDTARPAWTSEGPGPDAWVQDTGVRGDAGSDVTGAAPFVCGADPAVFATRIVEQNFGPGQDFGRELLPDVVLGPPRGGGPTSGSLHVASLGNGGSITVEFSGNAIVDGPGVDFMVFENPFNSGSTLFAELGTVAVSDDGLGWTSFECTAEKNPYGDCAGWRPVLANAELNSIDPTDPSVAGGDGFDLAGVNLLRARFVRITDRADLDGFDGVFDLDAVSIVNAACP